MLLECKGVVPIKLGTVVVMDENGEIDEEIISSVCGQCHDLQCDGYSPLIVSSGAVANARHPEFSPGLRATIGEPKKVSIFQETFLSEFGIISGQLLLTDENLKSSATMERLWESFYHKVVQILNANDGVWNEELKMLQKSADNDNLFGSVCLSLYRQIFLPIIVIKERGLLDHQGNVVPVVDKDNFPQALNYANGGNSLGYSREGMRAKLLVCNKLTEKGMNPVIVSVDEPDFILNTVKGVVEGNLNFGTIFV